MEYTIKAHPTLYNNILFRSRLEATWAAFFDLAGWKWDYEPIDVEVSGRWWSPDFWVSFPCGHSDCQGSHELLIEVKPYRSLAEFDGHIVGKICGCYSEEPTPAMFGIDPSITQWTLVCGSGGGVFDIEGWVRNASALWAEAKNRTQFKPS